MISKDLQFKYLDRTKKERMFPSRCAKVYSSAPPPPLAFPLSLSPPPLLLLLLLLIFDHIPPASLPCYKYLEYERERVEWAVEWSEKDGWDEGWIEVGGGKWRESCKLWGVSLNETRCVTALMCMCATVWIYALLFSRQIGQIWNFGIWAADQEFSSWGVRRGCPGGGGWLHRGPRGGVRMGCPSFSCEHAHTPAVCLHTPSLSHWRGRTRQ